MKHLLILLYLLPFTAFSQTFVDLTVFSSATSGSPDPDGILIDENNNIYIVGAYYSSGVSYGNYGISFDSYDVFVPATHYSCGFVAKLDHQLNAIWAKGYSSHETRNDVPSIAIKGEDEYWVITDKYSLLQNGDTVTVGGVVQETFNGMGTTTALFSTPGGWTNLGIFLQKYPNGDMLVAAQNGLNRISTNNTLLWSFPDSATSYSTNVFEVKTAVDVSERVTVAGSIENMNMVLNGDTVSAGNNQPRPYIYQCSPTGELNWFRSLDLSTGNARALTVHPQTEEVFVGGSFSGWIVNELGDTLYSSGGEDIYIARLSPTGQLLRLVSGGSPYDNQTDFDAMIFGPNGELYVSMSFVGGPTTPCHLNGMPVPLRFVGRLDTDMNLVWAKSIAPNFRETYLAVDNNSELILVTSLTTQGQPSYTIAMDGISLTYPGNMESLLVARICEDSNLVYITGRTYIDLDESATYTESDLTVGGLPIISNATTYTTTTGQYSLGVGVNTYTITCTPPLYYTAEPPSITVTTVAGMGMLAGQDFRLVPIGPITDLQVYINNLNPTVPGFDNNYHVQVTNIGTLPASGTLTVTLPAEYTYISATPAPSQVNGNVLEWLIDSLPIMQHLNFALKVNLLASTPLSIEVSVVANAITTAQDHTPADNTAIRTTTVVGSYDPNDKQALPTGNLSEMQIAEGIAYTIRFQNTGTWPAQNVRLLDTISPLLDVSTIRTIGSSHNQVMAHREGGVVEWLFPNINLPDSSVGLASQGFVTFHIMPAEGTGLGSTITNQAAIYFDFNAPIITNEVVQSVVVGIAEPTPANALMCYPNPTNQAVRIDFGTANAQPTSITFIDIMGRTLLQKHGAFASGVTLDVSTLPSGIYTVVAHLEGKEALRTHLIINR